MRALPFLLLSVAVVSLANAQESLFVREHNLTYLLGTDVFRVEETLVFEKPGDPFTYQGKLYFIRGDAEDVSVAGYPYSVSQTVPRKIILEFMISRGQKKKVHLSYTRRDLLREEDGVQVYRGLALGDYPWPVSRANIVFTAPEGYQFGRVSPATASLSGNRDRIVFTLSFLENASAILSGFPVEIEYADYKRLSGEEIKLSEMLLSTAEFEVDMGGIVLEKLRSQGVNVTLYGSHYSLSRAALQDARENYLKAQSHRAEREYYEAYAAAEAAGKLASLAIDEARKIRAAEAKQPPPEEATEEEMEADGANPPGPLPPETGGGAGRYTAIVLAAFLLAIAAATVLRKMRARPATTRGRGYTLLRRPSSAFEEEVERIKKRRAISARIRELMSERKRMEEKLEAARRSLGKRKITEKEYTQRRYKLLRRMGKLDLQVSRLEAELDKTEEEQD